MINSITDDLILEIFSRLPAKSITRFHCVSKLWRSILCGQFFTDLFLTRSSARPRLLFAAHGTGELEWHFFSSPQPRNPYDKSSLEVADSYMTWSHDMWHNFGGYASGLVYSRRDICTSIYVQMFPKTLHVICNPSTGEYVYLPQLQSYRIQESFLGFDPIDKQFKVLSIVNSRSVDENRVLTLGTGEEMMTWRKIKTPVAHKPCRPSSPKRICINGVLYYLAKSKTTGDEDSYVIVSFDVRSEKFNFIEAKKGECNNLINYKGKLGGITLTLTCSLSMWILEDAEKHEWSEYSYTLPRNVFGPVGCDVSVVGVIDTGEIVLSMDYAIRGKPFYVFYFHPERNSLQRVEIQGFENPGRVFVFVDHVEDLNLNVAKFLKSRISAPSVKNKSYVRERDMDMRRGNGVSRKKKQRKRSRRQ
ncbi:putative F-box protein [Raphanus sativus]|uniref:F-box protein At1g30925 n=1 Tax=Raphanus sativus TaxID=3726 RepID=A0A6J0MRI5_RAPSA|nr:putative F-box protein At1g30925 [Raphanus sativus]KAJ4917072.1 putative F-box protein [Raphanus sativus]